MQGQGFGLGTPRNRLSMNEQETTNDSAAAALQGWKLDVVYDLRGYFVQAIVPTRGSRFTTPFEAYQHAWGAAKRGDATARRALSAVAASEMAAKGGKKTSTKETT